MEDNKKKKSTDLVSVQPEVLSIIDKADLLTLDYDALVELGRGVTEVKTYSNWLTGKLGDAIIQCHETHKEKYGDLVKYASDIGQNHGSVEQYVYAYRKYTKEDPKFSPDNYFGRVPWGLIQLVASKSETPGVLLNELVDKGITSMEGGYREIKTRQTGEDVPRKPRVKLVWDENSKKWKIKIKNEDMDLIDWGEVREHLVAYLQSLM
jgi:hypothetical protein